MRYDVALPAVTGFQEAEGNVMGLFDWFRNNRFAKENGLSYEEVLLYNELNKDGKYPIEKFKMLLIAKAKGLSENEFKTYYSSWKDSLTLDEYVKYSQFCKKNGNLTLSYQEYENYIQSYQSGVSVFE